MNVLSKLSRRTFTAAGAGALTLALPGWTSAQTNFPSKPIRMILPFPAGGGADGAVRVVAEHLAKAMGVPFVVENKAGADGILAINELMNSAPDGHTIMFGSPTALHYVPLTRTKPPYDPLRDLQPISHFTSFTYFLYVNETVPANTFAEFLTHARASPGKLSYGTGDATSHMALALVAMHAKLDMVHVPYKGVSQAFQDFEGGRLNVMIGTVDLIAQSKGKARPLAVLLPQRSELRPDVPTFTEAGLPQINLRPWTAWFASAKTPKPIIDQLAAEMAKVFKQPQLREFFGSRGSLLEASTPEAMAQMLQEQMPIWRDTIRFAKIPMQDS
jgi:tripartite-type tricarboxylate transporter receptor subunit TctC